MSDHKFAIDAILDNIEVCLDDIKASSLGGMHILLEMGKEKVRIKICNCKPLGSDILELYLGKEEYYTYSSESIRRATEMIIALDASNSDRTNKQIVYYLPKKERR